MSRQVETYRMQKELEQRHDELDVKLDPEQLQTAVDIIISEGLSQMRSIIKDGASDDKVKINAFNAAVSTGRYLEQRRMNDEIKKRKLEMDFANIINYDDGDADEK